MVCCTSDLLQQNHFNITEVASLFVSNSSSSLLFPSVMPLVAVQYDDLTPTTLLLLLLLWRMWNWTPVCSWCQCVWLAELSRECFDRKHCVPPDEPLAPCATACVIQSVHVHVPIIMNSDKVIVCTCVAPTQCQNDETQLSSSGMCWGHENDPSNWIHTVI